MASNDGDAERKNMRENESQWKSKLPLVSVLNVHFLGNPLWPSPATVAGILLVCFTLALGHFTFLDMPHI